MVRESLVTAAALLAVLGAGCRRHEEAEAPAGKRPVRCAAVETATVEDTIELRGTVAPLPDRDAEVAPQVAGRIAKILVREGDRVTAGQPLARIDDAGLVDQANEAAAAVAKAEAERRNADATRARTERVFEHGIAARQEVEDAATRADTAAASEREARAAAARIRRQVERATVRSPLAGVVVRIFRRSGELVDGTPSTPVVEVADPSRLELAAEATASDLVRLAAEAPAEITTAALPGARWSGAVSVVSPAVDRSTGLGKVRIAIAVANGPRPPSESWAPRVSAWGARAPSRSSRRRRCATAQAQRWRSCSAVRTASRTSSARREVSRRAIASRWKGSPPATPSRWIPSGSPTARPSSHVDDRLAGAPAGAGLGRRDRSGC